MRKITGNTWYGKCTNGCFGEAEKIRPAGNDDAILRWNRCVRLLQTPGYAWETEFAGFDAHDMPPT